MKDGWLSFIGWESDNASHRMQVMLADEGKPHEIHEIEKIWNWTMKDCTFRQAGVPPPKKKKDQTPGGGGICPMRPGKQPGLCFPP